MGLIRSLHMGAINISLQSGGINNYINLFIDTHKEKRKIKVRGSDWAMISPIHSIFGRPFEEGIAGAIFKFVNIDPSSPWLDTEETTPLLDESEKPEWTIPLKLKPNLRIFDFVFFPNGHRLFFSTRDISPSSLSNIIRQLFQNDNITSKYKAINVNTEKSQECIEEILSIPELLNLDIHVYRPNPDDLFGISQKIQQRIIDQNLSKTTILNKASRGEGIKPDEETIAYMNVAKSNGYVEASGYDGDVKQSKSTEEKHRIIHLPHLPSGMNKIEALFFYGSRELAKIKEGK